MDDFIASLSHNSTLSKTKKLLSLVTAFPFRTSQELATKVNSNILTAEQIHKRLPDLRKRGKVINPEARVCTVTGKVAFTWAPVIEGE